MSKDPTDHPRASASDELAEVLADDPALPGRLLAEHVSAGDGTCKACVRRAVWPCRTHDLASRAVEIQRARARRGPGERPR